MSQKHAVKPEAKTCMQVPGWHPDHPFHCARDDHDVRSLQLRPAAANRSSGAAWPTLSRATCSPPARVRLHHRSDQIHPSSTPSRRRRNCCAGACARSAAARGSDRRPFRRGGRIPVYGAEESGLGSFFLSHPKAVFWRQGKGAYLCAGHDLDHPCLHPAPLLRKAIRRGLGSEENKSMKGQV